MKPVIIAIIGKSASGKDYLARLLADSLSANFIISDTTRPPREQETDRVDYNFISAKDFAIGIIKKKYLEYTSFRGWRYGTNVDAIQDGVNIGVFNLEGLQSLRQYEDKYIVIPIYLMANWRLRFSRMIKREHKIRLEFFRRLFVDNRDFKKSGAVLSGHNGGLLPYVVPYDYDIVLEDVRNTIQKAQSL